MKPLHLVFIVLFSAVLSVTAAYFLFLSNLQPTLHQQSRLDRIKRTGVIRCGYTDEPPFIIKDPKTRQISGMGFELIEEVAKQLSLKIDWTEQVGLASAFDGLKNGRYDVMCITFNQTPNRALATEFPEPIIFFPTYIYTRSDDSVLTTLMKKSTILQSAWRSWTVNWAKSSGMSNFPRPGPYLCQT